MKILWSYYRLFLVSMGFTLIMIVFKAMISLLLDNRHNGLISFYKAWILKISESIFTWNSFFVTIIIFALFLIFYRGKSPFPEDKFWLK